MYQISTMDLIKSLKKLNKEYLFFAPVETESNFQYQKFLPGSWKEKDWFFIPFRTPQPLKSFFYAPIEKIASYPKNKNSDSNQFKRVILGPKACDLHALKIIDQVYAGKEYPDPFYVKARQEQIIISTDCLEPNENCYCTLMNCQPYPKRDFDLNLSLTNNIYLIEIGTDRGKELLNKYFQGLKEASDSLILEREKNRERVQEQVQKQNQKYSYVQTHQEAIEKHLKTDIWQDLSKTCVECGTCTQICPTCHCFLLYDQPVENHYERIKVWDSCFFAGYSRMAGGLTPRLQLADRFKNRFYHKFDSFVTNFGMEACTGCGRCVEGCMGKIDLREVLLELEKRVILKESLDIE